MKKILFSVYFGVSAFVLSAQSKMHTVQKGETLYSLSRTYSVSITDLKRMNPELAANTNVKIGQKLFVAEGSKIQINNLKPIPARVHVIRKGDNLYALCKKYGVSITELKQWNSLTSLNVHPGQKIIVSKVNSQALYKPVSVPSTPDTPYREEDVRERVMMQEIRKSEATLAPETVMVEKPKAETPKPVLLTEGLRTSSSNATEYPAIFNQYTTHGFKIKKTKGAANYLADATSGNQHLAFYNDAETGSIIRVTNLMNKKTIFVKVMGKVPPTDAAQEITVKLTNTAAQDLGAVDEKFLVEVAAFSAN